MAEQDWKDGDTVGFLFPDEMVERLGLKEGDEFDVIRHPLEIALRPVGADLTERLRSAGLNPKSYSVTLQDLAKLA